MLIVRVLESGGKVPDLQIDHSEALRDSQVFVKHSLQLILSLS